MFEQSTIIAESTVMLLLTKRKVISLIGCFYDPLDFPSSIIKRLKVATRMNWDEQLMGETRKWKDPNTDLMKS